MPSKLTNLLTQISQSSANLPPVHQWHPEYCGDIDIRIKRDGSWWYMGTPIGRRTMVALFSSVLRYEDDGHYYLVTPVEKVRIQVDDAPFIVVEVNAVQDPTSQVHLLFRTQMDDKVVLNQEHPLWVKHNTETGEPSPYLHVRNGLNALISRSVFYQLVDMSVEKTCDGATVLGVESAGQFYVLGEST